MKRIVKFLSVLSVSLLVTTGAYGADLYAHYDASDPANVVVDVSDIVVSLTDLSGSGFDATLVGGAGTLLYSDPGNLSPTGLKGVDTNNGPHNKLLVLDSTEQDALLNFAGAAASNTGFAALVVFKADTVAGSTRNIVLASNGSGTAAGSFIMKYEGGVPQVILGGTSVNAGAAVVADGETVVLAVNYNQATGNMQVWDSENNTSTDVIVTAADFSSTQSLFLAGSLNNTQGMDGMIGEVKIYQGALTPQEFAAEQTALVGKWIDTTPVITSSLSVSVPLNSPIADYQITTSTDGTPNNAPVSFAAANLPDGLTLDTLTGVISGTPTESGLFDVNLSATNSSNETGAAVLALTVTVPVGPGPTIQVTAITGQAGTYAVGDLVTFEFTMTNAAELEELQQVPDDATAADAVGLLNDQIILRNRTRTARNITISDLNMVGDDIYDNQVVVPATLTASAGALLPGASFTFTGNVRIPRDGTFHRITGGGYSITGNFTFQYLEADDSLVLVPPAPDARTITSSDDILVDVPANLQVVDLAYPVKTFRGGDIIEITASIRNASGTPAIVRPLIATEDFRTEFYLSDDASIDRDNDFLLGFFTSFADRSFVDGQTQVRAMRVSGTPAALADPADITQPDQFGRTYIPQPDDGFLDIGETISVTLEVLVPTNYTGTYFAAAYTDSRGEIEELTEDVNASFGDQGDNVLVDSFTPNFQIASTTAPTTEPVSEVSDGNGQLIAASDGVSDNPSVSEDGKWIVFQSSATNLDPDLSGTGNVNIYLRNRETEAVTLISRANSGVIANRDSFNPVISADGRYIAYESLATNLAVGTQGGSSQIYAYDRELQNVERVSISPAGAAANGECYQPSISQYGRFIAFESIATNLLNIDDINTAQLASTTALQVYVHDRDVFDSGVFDNQFVNHLVSVSSVGVANGDALTPALSLDGQAVAFASVASNLGTGSNGHSQIWSRELGPDGVPVGEPVLVSLKADGTAGGNADSTEPAINGGPSAAYGLQIAFASVADDLIADDPDDPNDTNGIADIFVRDFSASVTTRVSVSNPRVAFGSIEFFGAIGPDNIPVNQPVPGDTVELNDGDNPPVIFTFDVDVMIGATTGETRDNLVTAINDATNLNIVAYASDAPTANLSLDGHTPSIQLFNTVPGEQGNQEILTTSLVLFTRDMSQGGTETGRSNDFSLGNPGGSVFGSLQPALDRSGRIVAFRSLTGGISVIRDGSRVYKPQSPTEDTPRVGELIRALSPRSSNVYFRDRDLNNSGILDQVDNTDTSLASVNKFGYRTTQVVDAADSASSRMPALSANGRFIAFASDATNAGGLRFDRTNTQPLDSNNKRDVFVYDRKSQTDSGGDTEEPVAEIVGKLIRNLNSGLPVAIRATVTGLEPMTFRWRKDGINLSDSARILGARSKSLLIEDLQPSDAGLYQLVAQNAFGVDSTEEISLTVELGTDPTVALKINSQPTDQEQPAGGSAVFSVSAVSSETISYEWMKDGQALSNDSSVLGAQSSQLQLLDLTTNDAGDYSVVVRDSSGDSETSGLATLTVIAAPLITSQPQGLTLLVDEALSLDVSASSTQPLFYQWLKNGTSIPGATAATYSVDRAQAIDAGTYTVRVSDSNGALTVSDEALVTIDDNSGGPINTSLPGPFQSASSLGSGWHHLPWFGSFASTGDAAMPWIYRTDLGWLYVDPGGSESGFWLWSDELSSWLWSSQSSAGNGFYYKWSDADWVFIQAKPDGNGAWILSTGSGEWSSIGF